MKYQIKLYKLAALIVLVLGIWMLMNQDWNGVAEAEKRQNQRQHGAYNQQEDVQDIQTDKDSGLLPLRTKQEPDRVKKQPTKEKTYRYIKGCNLSKKVQRKIFDLCGKKDISFEFIMAVIYTESSFNPRCVSDGGESVGLMQIQKRWHWELMDKLGCTDLTDPIQNVTVGVTILESHLKTYKEAAWALMAYNGGRAYAERMIDQGELSEYAVKVLALANRYERQNGLVKS